MHLRKNLYHVRFAHHNPYEVVKRAMKLAFPKLGPDNSWVRMDDYTYLVYSTQDFQSVRLMIGINMADDIDDFTIMNLDFGSAMSIFTDRLDIIEFLKMVKQDSHDSGSTPSEDEINRILDKISRMGEESLTTLEKTKLGRF